MSLFDLQDVLESKVDNTVKFIYKSKRGEIAEISHIDKQDGKDILCVPTQTNCKMGCTFCHLTGLDIPVRSFSADEIFFLVKETLYGHFGLADAQTLLISYMGAGEPLNNIEGVIGSALKIRHEFWNGNDEEEGDDERWYPAVRFAVASIVPGVIPMHRFTHLVKESGLNVKFHLSLHSPCDQVRWSLAKNALAIDRSLLGLKNYRRLTGCGIEAHYTLIDGVNDRPEDAVNLAVLLRMEDLPLKILRFSERSGHDLKTSRKEDKFAAELRERGAPFVEVYDPPGRDIGASCGMFLTDYYKEKASE